MRNTLAVIVFLLGATLLAASSKAEAQNLPAMGPPIPVTAIVMKPAPGDTYGSKQTVTMGVGDKVFKFILKDGFTNSLKTRWPDIWQYVQQYNPNFVVQGQNAETFAKIQPGQTMRIQGMFAPLDRTFEVTSVEEGGSGEQHY